MFGSKRQNQQLGLVPVPLAGYDVAVVQQWGPSGSGATPNTQIGTFGGQPRPTQIAGYYPGIQMKCGVEGIDRHWGVYTAHGEDVPYFQQTTRPANPTQTLRDGGKPGPVFGVGLVASLFGNARRQRAQAVQSQASGLLGW